MGKNAGESGGSVDGRVQRSERSRQIIISALLELISEGNLIPTAQQVADRANVAIRTVFRHFSEMEKLFLEMDDYKRSFFDSLFSGIDSSGSIEQRVERIVRHYADAYPKLAPYVRSNVSQNWRWPVLKQTYIKNQRRLRRTLDAWLPELAELDAESREAVDAIMSFEFWDRLVGVQGMSKSAAITLVAKLLLQYVEPSSSG